jgi:tetratricopeptide (TPR) repeat protein
VDVLTIGMDLDEEKFATSFELQARPETGLADLLVAGGETSLLHSFKPDHQITFRYRPFDMAAVMGFINDCFGDLYKKMGIDFSEIAAMCESFTGEMAGGISFGEEGIAMEVISVLKDTETTTAPDFLERVYLPWMAAYGRNMATMLEEQTGAKMGSFFARTSDSIVAGYKVMGMKTQFPYPQGPQASGADATLVWTAYEMRMATVDNLLLVADTDQGIAKLIDVAKTVEAAAAEGPLMTMNIDMGGYLNFLAQMMPQGAPPLPKLGKMVCNFDVKAGRASGRFAVMTDDIKTMVAHFKGMVQLAPVTEEAKVPPESVEANAEAEERVPEPPQEDPATQQLHKGALCATYGNDQTAVAYFQRAIEMDPENSEAHFQRGISLGELGRYGEAIASINKAMDLGNRKGLYLYGRGRVYLLSGDAASAMADFKAAAALGNRDAKEYLQSTLQARW